MNLIHDLALGFAVAFTLPNVLLAGCGALFGTLVGVLPGIGALAAIALLLPAVHALDPTAALILLAAVYYGAQYGGSTAAILVDAAGESVSVVTCLDGYQMARQGRAGAALAVAALGSFVAGCLGTLVLAALVSPLTEFAFRFGPAEYFSLMVLGLIGAVVLAAGSALKGLAMAVIGLLLAQIGTDAVTGTPRYGFGIAELSSGIGLVGLALGLAVCGAIVARLALPAERREVFAGRLGRLWPNRAEFRGAWPAVLRGSALGSLLGVLPGSAAALSSFTSQRLERRLAGEAGRFGKGDIRGVAGPESANNAGAQTSFMPMLALGIPPNAVMALLAGAMVVKGLAPGPQLMTSNPRFFWGLIASMWLGNLMLLVLNLPLAGVWRRLLRVPYRFVFPALVLVCALGAYSLHGRAFEVYLTALAAAAGYVFYKLGCEIAPLLLGFILGPLMETSLRRALALAHGDWSALVARPISAGLLIAAVLLIAGVMLPSVRRRREAAFVED